MTHAALSPLIEPEFDKFLGASISEDRNGPGLSGCCHANDGARPFRG